jgi:hypothetical protein
MLFRNELSSLAAVSLYLKTAVAENRMIDRKIKEDATDKTRVIHINALIKINVNDQKEGLEASESMSEGRGHVERLTK